MRDSDVIDLLVGILLGGRAGAGPGMGGQNPLLGVPSLSEAIQQDREAQARAIIGDVTWMQSQGLTASRSRPLRLQVPPKKKRKVSAYQKEFGRQLKRLKREHPRTPVTRLMKRAHAATRRARRGK